MAKSRRAKHAHTSHGFYSPRQLDERTEELQALLDEALTGSEKAHGYLLDSYRRTMLLYFAPRLSNAIRCKVDEDDLVQIASMQAMDKFAAFLGRTPQSYWAWLRQICASKVQMLVRWFHEEKRDISREETLDELRLDDGSQHPFRRGPQAPDEIVLALEAAGQLQATLDTLPKGDRQIVVWKVNDGLAFAEIARRLARSNDSIERTFHRSMARLKQWLKERRRESTFRYGPVPEAAASIRGR